MYTYKVILFPQAAPMYLMYLFTLRRVYFSLLLVMFTFFTVPHIFLFTVRRALLFTVSVYSCLPNSVYYSLLYPVYILSVPCILLFTRFVYWTPGNLVFPPPVTCLLYLRYCVYWKIFIKAKLIYQTRPSCISCFRVIMLSGYLDTTSYMHRGMRALSLHGAVHPTRKPSPSRCFYLLANKCQDCVEGSTTLTLHSSAPNHLVVPQAVYKLGLKCCHTFILFKRESKICLFIPALLGNRNWDFLSPELKLEL